jgi:diguanylate cyclase (GGDEF)-like protein/PAS domain S-box-containing protein
MSGGSTERVVSERNRDATKLSMAAVVGLSIVLFVGATLAIGQLGRGAFQRLRSSATASDLLASINQQSALEWSVRAEGQLSEDAAEDLGATREDIERDLDRMAIMRVDDVKLAALRSTSAALEAAVDREIALVEEGRLEAAERVDEGQVDPTFERLQSLTMVLKKDLDRRASVADRYSTLGSLGLGLLVALGTGVLFTKYSRGRRRADLLAGERTGLVESEGKYRAMLESSSEIIIVLSSEQLIEHVSPSVEKILGYSVEELLGKHIALLIAEGDWEPSRMNELRRAAEDEHVRNWQPRMLRSDGTELIFEVMARDMFEHPRIGGLLLNCREVTQEIRLQKELKYEAFHDSLTRLPNRKLFSDRIDHALLLRKRHPERELAVMFLDLDGFKEINDRFGHQAGDEVLVELADRLKGQLREGDTCARLGGDEFGVLMEDFDSGAPVQVARRLVESLTHTVTGLRDPLTVSVGIAISGNGDTTAEELLRDADIAMYEAKREGPGNYRIFENELLVKERRRIDQQSELRAAIGSGEIILHYQPIYKLDPLEVVGVEALARWDQSTRGMIPPGEFIPLAEKMGLSSLLGNQILDIALLQLREWGQTLKRSNPLKCGVNFSAQQLAAPTFVGDVAAALERSGVDPEHLVIEITETALMEDPDDVARKLLELRQLGAVFALDDFGTGYSSLSYLQTFPVRILKMDRSFVNGMGAGPEDSAYPKAIIRLGHSLGFDVVAEGVETSLELDELTKAGCDFAQGYWLARPAPAALLEELLREAPKLMGSPEEATASHGSR